VTNTMLQSWVGLCNRQASFTRC